MSEVPPVVQAWVAQLLDPRVVDLVRLAESGQIDIRLSASRGRVRPRPVITFDGGPSGMVDPT